jgi:PEP-CTERM motif
LPNGTTTTPDIGTDGKFTLAVNSAIPEPSTWAMMLLGFAGLGFAGYRQRQKFAGFKTV